MATYESTAQLSGIIQQCCHCPVQYNRCLTDECPCFAQNRLCSINCETNRLASNCLNKAICRCSCQALSSKGFGSQTKLSKKASIKRSRSQSHKSRGQFEKSQSPAPGPISFSLASVRAICNENSCDCYRYSEQCSALCACRKECELTKDSLMMAKLYSPSRKRDLATLGCKCGTGKKACSKSNKCSCRQGLSHCTIACKCQCDCTNNKIRIVPKQIKQVFLTPDDCNGQMGLILRLTGENDYLYQTEFIGTCEVLLSRSPCFHQDCDPKCEVLQTCMEQKACARLLAVAYGQIQKHLGNCHIQMAVKFLTPYVKRGDLYTQQGIMQMLEAGIIVEPIVLKDWGRILISPGQTFAAAMASQTRNMTGYDTNGDASSPAAVISDPALALWAQQCMDTHVRRSQHYINACRCSLGLKPQFWSSPFHDLLQTTVLTCALTERRVNAILKKLAQLDPYLSASNSMSTSICSSMVFTDNPNDTQRNLRPPMQASKSMDACIAQIAHINSTSSPTAEGEPADYVCNVDTSVVAHPTSDVIVQRDVMQRVHINKHKPATDEDPIDQVEKLLAGFSGRNLGDSDREEIQTHLHKTLSKVSNHLNELFQFLQDRS